MATQVPVMNSLSTITGIVLVIAIIAIVLILILLKLYQVKSAARSKHGEKVPHTKAGDPSIVSPEPIIQEYEPVRPVPEPEQGIRLRDQGDISKNMQAFIEKYHLDSFTLSSDDGLVIASTSTEGQRDAANYSQSFRAGQQSPEPGTMVFGMNHRGSTIIGIIKSGYEIAGPVFADIEADANNILIWGL
ncbi:MAG TPA: hypothetical protein VMS89_07580 [Methanoregulaceae archaeon]|nr:hypothetical protein [Methanoregulaceae archaeon]